MYKRWQGMEISFVLHHSSCIFCLQFFSPTKFVVDKCTSSYENPHKNLKRFLRVMYFLYFSLPDALEFNNRHSSLSNQQLILNFKFSIPHQRHSIYIVLVHTVIEVAAGLWNDTSKKGCFTTKISYKRLTSSTRRNSYKDSLGKTFS